MPYKLGSLFIKKVPAGHHANRPINRKHYTKTGKAVVHSNKQSFGDVFKLNYVFKAKGASKLKAKRVSILRKMD